MLRSNATISAASLKGARQTATLSGVILLASSSFLFLSGCGVSSNPITQSPVAGNSISGKVHGGSQPVAGATVTLYAAANTDYAAASTSLGSTTSDSGGNFNITGGYTCPTPTTQVYITATGGDPTITAGVTNPNLALAVGLGNCGNLSAATFISINEVTTVATAYALAQFSTDLTHVGTSATNAIGLQNAMAKINNLVDTTAGVALSTTPYYAQNPVPTSTPNTYVSIVPTQTLNTLGDILANCVNSTGGVANDGSNCGNLFGAVAGATPTDTFQAALRIAQHQGSNVTGIYNTLGNVANSPFPNALTAAPQDWTVSILYVGGGLGQTKLQDRSFSNDLKIDGQGNVWISNQASNTLTLLSPLGVPLSPTKTPTVLGGFPTGLIGAGQIAIDLEGNAWVTAIGGTQISAVSPTGGLLPGAPYTDPSLTSVQDIAVDGLDNVWVVALQTSTLAKFNHDGTLNTAITNGVGQPYAVCIDENENAFLIDSQVAALVEYNNAGSLIKGPTNPTAVLQGFTPFLACDHRGHTWYAMQQMMARLTTTTTPFTGDTYVPNSYVVPGDLSIDGAGNVYVPTGGGPNPFFNSNPTSSMTVFDQNGNTLSPAPNGYLTQFGDNQSDQPHSIAIDPSGSAWLLARNGYTGTISASTVQDYIGLAVPVATPISTSIKNGNLAMKP